jgi:osmotically-inducible protein OsmY
MKKISAVFLAILMLQGCIPAAFVAGTAAGVVIFDHRSTQTIVEDRDITFKIQHKFDTDQELHNKAHLAVTSFNHIVLLLGQASSAELRSKAEAIAKSNDKVKMIYNEITVEDSISNMASANDSWITTKVKTLLAATPGLSSANLKVVTENKVVYLLGLTSRTQAKIAADKTRTVAGVQKVVKLFEYLN